MKDQVKRQLSNSLQRIRHKGNYSVALMADTIGIPPGSLQKYLYGISIPPLDVVVRVCNCFSYSINTFFGECSPQASEQQYISLISNSLIDEENFVQGKISRIVEPVISAMVEGTPLLYDVGFGTKLKILREDIRLSSADFSRSCNIAVNTLKSLESDQRLPSIPLLLSFCDFLHVSPEYMLSDHITYDCVYAKQFYYLTPRQLKALSELIFQYGL